MARLKLSTAVIVCLAASRLAVAADAIWPQFRGPNGSGVAEETGVPIEFGPAKNVLWKTPVPEGHSSPVAWNDRIFLTAFDQGRLETICLDRATGSILWRRTAEERKKLRKGHGTNSRASPTPATDGNRVYVYFGPLGLIAYDFDGAEQWRVSVPQVKQPWGVGTSPVVAGDRVLLNIDYDIGSFLVAVDAATGKELWKTERPEFRRGWSTPLILPEDNQVVVAGSLRLAAYDLQSGREVWTVRGLPYQVSPSPVFADGMIYIAAWDAFGSLTDFDVYLATFDKNKDEKITSAEHNFAWEYPKYDRDKDGFVTRSEFDGFIQFSSQSRNALLVANACHPADARHPVFLTKCLFPWFCFRRETLAVLVAFALAGVPNLANAQLDADGESPLIRVRELAGEALTQLRGDDLPRALITLGAATDLAASLATQEDALATQEDFGLAPAAAGLHRKLVQQAAEVRFDLLHEWSLPTESRRTIRMLTSLVPQDVPPKAFARAIGERPRDDSFPVWEISGINGLFSSAWLLVKSAEENGRLRQLITELRELSEQNVVGADAVLTLARIVDANARDGQLVQELEQHLAQLRRELNRQSTGEDTFGRLHSDALADAVLAIACLGRDWLQPIGEGILENLIERTYGRESWLVRPFLRRAHAAALQKRHSDVSSDVFAHPRLMHWVAASGYDSNQSARGAPRAVWLAIEDHILHLTGPRNDSLFFRYPLTGEFEFSCEAQDGGPGGAAGGVTYGGLGYEAWGAGQLFKAWDADFRNEILLPCPFVRVQPSSPTFNRLSLTSTASGTTFASNGHPIWSDTSNDRSSPWIGLRSFNDRRPIFRNITITGAPVIPSEVRLIEGDRLSGWLAGYYNQTIPTPLPIQNRRPAHKALPTAENDWFAQNGILHGSKRENTGGSETQSCLYYSRPLLNGESISYEFQYEPDCVEVHPMLGRLAFLIEPGGVRLHWMTDGDREWTGLAEDNAIIEPFNRRGPRPLALTEGDWHRVTLALENDTATLSLNGTTIYQRVIESGHRRKFGFYHNRHHTAARVRNVVMRGDWPERLPDELLGDLVQTDQARHPQDHLVINAVFDDQFIAENVFALRERVASMPREDQFDALAEWVLPGRNHATFRLAGDFTSTHPMPLAQDGDPIDAARLARAASAGTTRVEVGGNLVAPALDLVHLAAELDRLAELRAMVTQAPADDMDSRRARRAMLILVDLAAEDIGKANDGFEQLLTLGEGSDHTTFATRWPEALVASRGVVQPRTRAVAAELLRSIYSPQIRKWQKSGSEQWHDYLAALTGLQGYLELEGTSVEQFWIAPGLKQWIPVSYTNARTRGEGRTRAAWHWHGSQVDNMAGHEQDYLFYRVPLRGNYEVECDVTAFGWRDSHLMVAGTVVAPAYTRLYGIGDFRRVVNSGKIDPVLAKCDAWVRYRTVVRDGISTTYFNGRKIHEQQLGDEPDPWLAIRSWSRHQGAVRDLRISGKPVVPEQINLSARPDLPGWIPYFNVSVNGAGSNWRELGDPTISGGILGRRRPMLTARGVQRLLRYHRPMVEDGTIEYEFYYKPGETATHPALDRLAFMLAPDGVRLHWITDGHYDKTGLSPSNVVDEPGNRRGPESLPLKSSAWNRLRLTLRGDTVDLELNGQLVYQRELEATNLRTFGLFHYADQTESRVRNVVWRGDWPREVPAIGEQEMAGEMADFLDEQASKLTAVFEHDFTKDGLPEKFFRQVGKNPDEDFSAQEDGLHVTREALGTWSQATLAARLRVRGDFDITATFEGFEARAPGACNALLDAILEGETPLHCRTNRGDYGFRKQSIRGQLIEMQTEGGRRVLASRIGCEARSGRLRVARRDSTVYFLFAEGDSPVFRIVGQEVATTHDLFTDGVRLVVSAGEGGKCGVVWKKLSVRAEQLMFTGKPESPVLFVMSADGKEVRQLTEPIGDLGSHGSPAWSPDGKQVAFDTNNGSTVNAHIYIVNADGSGLKDLGIGCMPTFSPNGQRIAFSWSGGGISVMNADGTNREILDANGWGAQWSPDGKSIAYGSSNITVLDLATKKQRTILEGEHALRYAYVYWNIAWSLDSKRICFKARTRTGGKYEIAVADVMGSSRGLQVLYASEAQTHADFAWHPNGKQILCAMNDPRLGGRRLFTLDANAPAPPQLLATQPLNQNNAGADWTRDGKYIVFSSQRLPGWDVSRKVGSTTQNGN